MDIRRVPPQAENCRRAGTPDPRAGISLKLPAAPRGTGSPSYLRSNSRGCRIFSAVPYRKGAGLDSTIDGIPTVAGKSRKKKEPRSARHRLPRPSCMEGASRSVRARFLMHLFTLLQSPGRAQSPAPAPARLMGPHILFEQTGAKNLERNVPA